MTNRNIGLCIVLSIITCGIYGLYWFVVLTNEANYASGHSQDGTSGGMALLLTIVTCGVYGIYWAYKMGEKVSEAKAARGLVADSNMSVIFLVLSIFGLGIIVEALVQNELNKMVDTQA